MPPSQLANGASSSWFSASTNSREEIRSPPIIARCTAARWASGRRWAQSWKAHDRAKSPVARGKPETGLEPVTPRLQAHAESVLRCRGGQELASDGENLP